MKILLVDDHTLFRDALVQYINRAEPDTEILLAKDFYEGKNIIENNRPLDLVLLDLKMPGMHGLNGLETLKKQYPDLKIALMSGVAENKDVKQAIELGVNGYFPKTLSGKELLKGIQKVLAGKRFIPMNENDIEPMSSYYDDEAVTDQTIQNISDIRLSNREKEVLSFLMEGLSNKEIASNLNLQEVTIKLHVRGVCRKLNVKNRTQAAIKAKELQLL